MNHHPRDQDERFRLSNKMNDIAKIVNTEKAIYGKDVKEAIEVVYLSDKPIRDPENDLEERVSNLEKLLGSIRDLIVSFLNNFNKNKN